MEDKELMQKFQMFEQQIMQTQEQLQAVEQGTLELKDLTSGLSELIGKEGKEILAPIGRGIFVKAKLLSEELTVDVGEKKFVKKSIDDTKKIIDDQLGKLIEVNVNRRETEITIARIAITTDFLREIFEVTN